MKKITMSAIVEDGTEEEICQKLRTLVGEKKGTMEDLQTNDTSTPNPPPKGSGATLEGVA